MNISTHATERILSITRSLEEVRNDLSNALGTPSVSGGPADIERNRIEELHRRLTGALSALHGEARDW